MSVFLFDFEVSFLFAVGASLVIVSTYIYGLPEKQAYLPVEKEAQA